MLAPSSTPAALAELRSLQPRRVCLIKPSAMGDIVGALPVLAALRQRWPQAWIAWVVNESFRDLLDGHPALDAVIAYDRRGARPTPAGAAGLFTFLRQLRRGRFDLVVDLQGLLRSGLMALATGAKARVGLADAREGASWCYTHHVPPPGRRDQQHAVRRLLRLAEVFGADVEDPQFLVPTPGAERAWARATLAPVPRPRLVLNLGASWKTKRWPPEHFAAIARRAARTYGAGLVAIGGAQDGPLVADLARRIAPNIVLDLSGRTSLRQLAAVAAESDLVLSNDSGPLHLSSAAGARVIGVYTCTSAALHGPCGANAVAIQSDIWCAGSYRKRCGRLECMRELTPERVWPLVARALDAACRQQDAAAAVVRHSSPPEHRAGSR
jgi:lipopolysaccharide heptosyltransferase I